MTVMSHILATYFLGKLLKLKNKKDWFLAFLFGVGIDFLDTPHLLASFKVFFLGQAWFGIGGQYYLRSFIQEPVSLIWVIIIGLLLKSSIPAIFFSLHVAMDYICLYEKRPFWPFFIYSTRWGLIPSGTFLEFIISLGLLLILLYIKRRKIFFLWREYNYYGKSKRPFFKRGT